MKLINKLLQKVFQKKMRMKKATKVFFVPYKK